MPNSKNLTKPLKLLIPGNHANANKIDVAQLVNQITYIERPTRKDAKKKHVNHKIKRGETLSGVARKYGTSTASLMIMNSLESSIIKIGQVIKVRTKQSKTKRI